MDHPPAQEEIEGQPSLSSCLTEAASEKRRNNPTQSEKAGIVKTKRKKKQIKGRDVSAAAASTNQCGGPDKGGAVSTPVEQKQTVRHVQIGTAMVDSGMLMIVDPCYVLRSKWGEEHALQKAYDPVKDSDYETACDVSARTGYSMFARRGCDSNHALCVQ